MNTVEQKEKYPSLDIAKFLCSIFILLYHFFSEIGSLPPIIDEALSLYAVCVALFMVISGFLMWNRVEKENDEKKQFGIVRKQVLRILQIYLIWSVPYLIYSISRWNFESITIGFVLWKIQGWIFGSTFYTIWFMPSLAIGLILSFFVIKKCPSWIAIVLCVLFYVVGGLNSTYSFLISKKAWYGNVNWFIKIWLNGERGGLFYAFPLVSVGYLIACLKTKFKPLIMAFLSFVAMIALLVEALVLREIAGHTGIDLTLTMPIVIFCVMGFLVSVPIKDFALSIWMRNMSTLIFMSQRLFLTVLPGLFVSVKSLYEKQLVAFLIVCIGTIVFSSVVILLAKKIRCLRKIF